MSTGCLNYGTLNGTSCTCPPSLGGATCDTLTCGNAILPPSQRQAILSSANALGCGSQCSAGWTGLGCNVCESAQACTAAIAAAPDVQSTSSSSTSTSPTSAANNDTVVCSSSAYTYSESFLNCAVDNPTLQAVYAGNTTLTIQRTANASFGLSAPYGNSGTLLAQIWYSPNSSAPPVEQFYCSAKSCTQTNATSTSGTVSYACSMLACSCIDSAAFCGGPGSVLSIHDTVNGLSGPLTVECSTANNGQCYFKQSILQGLFGDNGLVLSQCRSGECVRQSVIDALSTDDAVAGGDSLSGGVIAGLVVVGVVVGLLGLLLLLGKVRQKRARQGKLGGTSSRAPHPLVGLRWQNVRYTLPNLHTNTYLGHRVLPRRRSHAAGKVILHDVSGSVPPGGLLAILGPSGAGKSTLVDILAGKRKVGRTDGSVTLMAAEGAGHSAAAVIGFVDQEDVLPATSTVREALMFAAELKLPEVVTRSEKIARVDSVLEQLGLTEVADSRIGSGERRGISGGERRRLSIGLELMAQPSILILDEPTSGLDSVSAVRVIEVLRNLSCSNRSEKTSTDMRTTVVACIHQPNSQIYRAFDLVSLLTAGGRQIYFGPTDQAADYFAERGHTCPPQYNVADFLLEIASAPLLSDVQVAATTASRSSSRVGEMAIKESFESAKKEPEVDAPSSPLRRQPARPVATLMTQFEVIALRELRDLKRDLSLFAAQVAAACAVGLFVGGMYYQTTTTIAGFQNRIGSLFFLGSLLAFWAMSALANLARHRQLFLRERASNYYSPGIWLLSRALFDIVPLRILPTIILSIIVYFMVGAPDSATAATFFKYLLVLVEFSIGQALWNLFLAASIANFGVAILLSALVNLFQMALAGFFVSLTNMPGCLRWLQWLDPLRYTLEALTVNEVNSGLQIQDTVAGVQVSVSANLIMRLLFNFDTGAYYRDVLVLFAWIGGYMIAVVAVVTLFLHEIR